MSTESTIDLDAEFGNEVIEIEELDAAHEPPDIVHIEGVVVKAAKMWTEVDRSMPVVEFTVSLPQPIDDFEEVSVQVRGGDEFLNFAMEFKAGRKVTAEGKYSVLIYSNGDQTAWIKASVLGLYHEDGS